MTTDHSSDGPSQLSIFMLGALGVVFGDIGTSPIYAFRESIRTSHDAASPDVILGLLSLIFWAVTLVVAIKYVLIVMRADNHGEGGTMALLTLALPASGPFRGWLLIVGLAGASLFFGDAMITPAISVLSAVEGMQVATPIFTPYVVPLTACVLVGLFLIQSHGSGKVGRYFGPIMAIWFAMLATIGLWNVIKLPAVLVALNPQYAINFLAHANAWTGFTVLGSVFLALTGGEALYADMGHFGRRAIRFDWFGLVMPALVLNYLGQGAVVLSNAEAQQNPFFLMFPDAFLIPVVILSTAATVIASQAVISGAFALVQQAIQLGALPRLDVRQTSEEAYGQVYIPQINWLLAVAVLALVFSFRSSDALANAYGIAVAGDMLVTTVLVTTVARGVWNWPWIVIAPVASVFFAMDLIFVASNVHKIPDGGWFPLATGGLTLTLMLSWQRARAVAFARREEDALPLTTFLAQLAAPNHPLRVPGTAVYLTTRHDVLPAALALNLKHNGVVHEALIFLKVSTARRPRVPEDERLRRNELAPHVQQIELIFGFAEKADVLAALTNHNDIIGEDVRNASFFLGREVPIPALRPDVPLWQEQLYAFMTRNAVRAPDYFLIPPTRVVELGTKVEL